MANTSPLISDKVILKLRALMENRVMKDTCNILRGVGGGGTDPYGQPNQAASWPILITALKCDFQSQVLAVTGEIQNANTSRLVGQYQLLIPLNTDVKPSDRVSAIKDRFGVYREVANPTYEILQVAPTDTELALVLQVIS